MEAFEHRGCRLAYAVAGHGPRVLWIQGTGLHGEGWRPQLDAFVGGHACLWFDNRGMARSQPVGDVAYGVEQLADDAVALLDHVGWERAHVVGHSLGGCIAIALALANRERVASLSLLCAAADGARLVAVDGAMLWRALRMQFGTRRARRRAFLEVVLTAEQHASLDLDEVAERLRPLFGQDLAERPKIVWKQVGAVKRWNATGRLGELRGVPTLVVGGDEDVIARPALVRALGAGILGARVVVLERAAHGVPVMEAERINALVREHIAAVEGGG